MGGNVNLLLALHLLLPVLLLSSRRDLLLPLPVLLLVAELPPGGPSFTLFREGWVIRVSEPHSSTLHRSKLHSPNPPCGKIEASGDCHVLYSLRKQTRTLLPLLPILRSNHSVRWEFRRRVDDLREGRT